MSEKAAVVKNPATKKPQSSAKARAVRSKKNDLIGVVVLAGGIGLLLGVGSYIYLKENAKGRAAVTYVQPAASEKKEEVPPDKPDPKVAEQTQTEAEQAASACIGCSSGPQFIMPPLPDAAALSIPTHEEVKGRWTVELPDGVAVAVFSGQAFQIVYSGRSDSDFRKYARGYYSYDPASGVISLKPAHKLGPPKDVPGIVYQVLTYRYFDVILRKNAEGSSLYWQAPPETLASMQVFPLLLYTGLQKNPYLKWDKAQ